MHALDPCCSFFRRIAICFPYHPPPASHIHAKILGSAEATAVLKQSCEELWLLCCSCYGPNGRSDTVLGPLPYVPVS